MRSAVPWILLLLLSGCERPVQSQRAAMPATPPSASAASEEPASPSAPAAAEEPAAPVVPAAPAPPVAAPPATPARAAAPVRPAAEAPAEEPVTDAAGRPVRQRTGARPLPRRAQPDTGIGGDCRGDDDCTAVSAGCCGCRNGGAQRAVPKTAAAAAPGCQNMMCPMVMSRHPSCQKVPRCVGGRCALAPAPGGPGPRSPGQMPDADR